MRGFIYFIAAEALGTVKIGFSDAHPEQRLKGLQTGCPALLKLLAFVEGSMSEERGLHRALSALRTQGEWFRFEGDVRFLVNTLSGCAGSSPRVLFDQALKRIAEQRGDVDLDYVDAPLGQPFRGVE